jgi:hypothetical protein
MSGLKTLIDQIEQSNEAEYVPMYLQRLLEICIAVTGRGNISDDYMKLIEFPINDLVIYCDSYYGEISISKSRDKAIRINNENDQLKLAHELKNRLLSFDKKYKKIREKLVKDIFDKPFESVMYDSSTEEMLW